MQNSSVEPENSIIDHFSDKKLSIHSNNLVVKLNSFFQRVWWLASVLSFTFGVLIGTGAMLGLDNMMESSNHNSSASELGGEFNQSVNVCLGNAVLVSIFSPKQFESVDKACP